MGFTLKPRIDQLDDVTTNKSDISNGANKLARATDVKDYVTEVSTGNNDNLNNHINDNNNPHQVTLEQARSQDEHISGDIDFVGNRAINLPDPTSENEPLIYGGTNEKWFKDSTTGLVISSSSFKYQFARNNNNISSAQYLRTTNGMATNNNSNILPYNMVLTTVVASRKGTADSYILQIRKNGDATDIHTTTVAAGNSHTIETDLNIIFDAGDLLNIRIEPSGTIEYPMVELIFKRRQ